MKTESKSLDKCQVELKVTLDGEEMKPIVKEVERTFMREVRLPGFRPGKVPLEQIRKHFLKEMTEETNRAMIRRYYADAVKAEGIAEVALVDAKDFVREADKGGFTAIVDIKPKFKLPTYKGLKIAEANTKVEDAAVNEQVERMRAGFATYEDAKEGESVGKGDFVQIDYAGTVDKKPIAEVAPEAKFVAAGTGFWTQVEEGRFLPEILDALVGMKIGEKKEGVKATFDKEAAPDPLKGKKALYDVTLKAFRRRVLPSDADFAAKTKDESYEKLVARVREMLEKQAVESEAARRENEAVELLLKKVDFEVPGSQVANLVNYRLNELQQRAQASGLPADYFQQQGEKILKDATEGAEKQVRLWYVIDAIAEAEKIDEKDGDKGKKVIELILANAKK